MGDTDQNRLIEDIIRAEGGDKDSAAEFICGTGIEGEIADQLVESANYY
jgi:hypothetical protein